MITKIIIQKDFWDKSGIIILCFLTALIAIGTIKLAFFSIPELSKTFENITISRGRCLTPHSIYGIVKNNEKPIEAKITITNLNTRDQKILSSNSAGEYIESIGNFPNCWVGGDKIKITACIENKCKEKEFIFKLEGGGTEANINI